METDETRGTNSRYRYVVFNSYNNAGYHMISNNQYKFCNCARLFSSVSLVKIKLRAEPWRQLPRTIAFVRVLSHLESGKWRLGVIMI